MPRLNCTSVPIYADRVCTASNRGREHLRAGGALVPSTRPAATPELPAANDIDILEGRDSLCSPFFPPNLSLVRPSYEVGGRRERDEQNVTVG